jgi:hypothetical protein
MFVAVAIVAAFVSVAAGLPGAWARRHSPRAATLAHTFTLAGLAAIVAAAATLGLASGLAAALGVALGQVLADCIATAAWGSVARARSVASRSTTPSLITTP